MPLTTAQRDALVTALRLRAGITDTDPRIRTAALSIIDSGATNATSTVGINSGILTVTGDVSGVDNYGLGSSTLTQLRQSISLALAGAGVTVELVAPDDAQPAADLLTVPATDMLGTRVTLYVQSILFLEQLVDDALARMERYCRTVLVDDGTTVQQVTLWQPAGGVLHLDDARITQVDMVGLDAERAISAVYSGAGRGTIEVTEDQLVVQTIKSGVATETAATLIGATVPDVVAVVDAVPGWTVTTLSDVPAENLVRMPPQRVTAGTDVGAWLPADGDYRLDRQAGVIYTDEARASWGGTYRTGGQAFVRYRAGFATLPADLEGVLLTAAKAGLDAQRRDAGLQSESLGDYSWTAAAGSVPAAAVDEALRSQAAVLDTYRRLLP